MRYTNYNILLYVQTYGFHFSTYDAKKAVYCLDVQKNKYAFNFSTWLKPFQFDIWIVIFVFLMILPMPFVSMQNSLKQILGNIVNDVLILLGIFFSVALPIDIKKRMMYIGVSILGFFLCGIYENIILSRVVLSPKPTKYLNLASILSDEYKIVWFNKTVFLPPQMEFEGFFKLHRLNHLLNSSFHEIKLKMPYLQTKAHYLALKNMIFSDESNLPYQLPYFEKTIKFDTEKDTRCFTLPEQIESSPSFWEIYTLNRYWLMKSINRMRESGLTEKWDYCSNWANKLESKLFGERDHQSDTITLLTFSFPLIILTFMCDSGVLIFVCEFVKHY